jgi:phosphonoacetaldehyde hydrolase
LIFRKNILKNFIKKMDRTGYRGPIRAVVIDWAGSAVDYGCMGPVGVFINIFNAHQIRVTRQEARQFMGLAKKDHIRSMCGLESVKRQWQDVYKRFPTEKDVDILYDKTSAGMIKAIVDHSEPIPGVLAAIAGMREMGIKIGSSTGYTREMMDVLAPLAGEKGYAPDAVVCSSDVPKGRPFPWMCYRNAILLETYPMEAMVKIGDTLADIEEGLNAGMWTIGITKTGNELGMTEKEVEELEHKDLRSRLKEIESKFMTAGAHFVVESLHDCVPVIEKINLWLADPRRVPKKRS